MAGGCTNCGKKGGCDHRKGEMFAAIDAALARLYPSRTWGERADPPPGGEPDFPRGVPGSLLGSLSDLLSRRLGALAVLLRGDDDQLCDFVYLLCLGRSPSLVELREGLVPLTQLELDGEEPLIEQYLRVAVSSVAPFAAVQQLSLEAVREGSGVFVTETLQPGVFDPVLLPRFRTLVAVLAELGIRHLDFGEINEPPPGFAPGDYRHRYGVDPAVANYLFYPQPPSSITTTVLSSEGGAPLVPRSWGGIE